MREHLKTQATPTAQAGTARLPIPSTPPADVMTLPEPEPGSGPEWRGRQAVPQTWHGAVIADYHDSTDARRVHLRRRLVERLEALTGYVPMEQTIVGDDAAWYVAAVIDGVMYRLSGSDLVVMRACAYCGAGHFESPSIASLSDLGYVLAGWAPYHSECAPTDPPDDASW